MDLPVKYDHIAPLAFGGTLPEAASFDNAKAVILPIPLESTTSYVNGTRNGPREILVASSHMELWDEELNTDIHGIGIYTLPEMELPFDDMGELMADVGTILPILKSILEDVHALTSNQLTDIATNVDKLIETNSITLERLLNRVDHIAANIENVTSSEAGDAKVAIKNVREITEKMELRYLGAVPPEFEEALWFEGRTVVVITPVRWLAWDQGKTS